MDKHSHKLISFGQCFNKFWQKISGTKTRYISEFTVYDVTDKTHLHIYDTFLISLSLISIRMCIILFWFNWACEKAHLYH